MHKSASSEAVTSLHDLSAVDLIAGFRAGQFSPTEAMDDVLAHIAVWEPHIKALYAFDRDGAVGSVEQDQHGLPSLFHIAWFAERHRDGRNFNPALRKCRIILERCELASVLQRNSANGSSPKLNFGQRHGLSPHCHFLVDVLTGFVVDARWRFRPAIFNCATGLGTGSGISKSKRSITSSTRHTRMNPDNCVATAPVSNRSTVRFETPACVAS